jgi:hypothetical protein
MGGWLLVPGNEEFTTEGTVGHGVFDVEKVETLNR